MKKKRKPVISETNLRTDDEITMNSFKGWKVERVKANKFRILKCDKISGLTAYRFEYKTFWGWKSLTNGCPYLPLPVEIYLTSIREAAMFLQCHFGYGTIIVTEFRVL